MEIPTEVESKNGTSSEVCALSSLFLLALVLSFGLEFLCWLKYLVKSPIELSLLSPAHDIRVATLLLESNPPRIVFLAVASKGHALLEPTWPRRAVCGTRSALCRLGSALASQGEVTDA